MVDDPAPHLRLQLAFSFGAVPGPTATEVLVKLLLHPQADSWLETAVLSSCSKVAVPMIEWLGKTENAKPTRDALVSRLAVMVGARNSEDSIANLLQTLAAQPRAGDGWKLAIIQGLGQGMQNSARPLYTLWDKPPQSLEKAVAAVKGLFSQTVTIALSAEQSEVSRIGAIRFLAYGPFTIAEPVFKDLLSAQQSIAIQSAVVKGLASRSEPAATALLVSAWERSGPSLRRELLESLCSRPDRVAALLDAIEAKRILPAHLESSRLEFLRKHPNAKLGQRSY